MIIIIIWWVLRCDVYRVSALWSVCESHPAKSQHAIYASLLCVCDASQTLFLSPVSISIYKMGRVWVGMSERIISSHFIGQQENYVSILVSLSLMHRATWLGRCCVQCAPCTNAMFFFSCANNWPKGVVRQEREKARHAARAALQTYPTKELKTTAHFYALPSAII